MPPTYKCAHCEKTFASSQGVNSHTRTHSPNWEASKQQQREAHAKQSAAFRDAFKEQKRRCEQCGKPFSFGTKDQRQRNRFCDRSCAAKTSNVGRSHRSDEARQRLGEKLAARTRARASRVANENFSVLNPRAKPLPRHLPSLKRRAGVEVVGPYSRLIGCQCAHCDVRWVARTWRKYCDEHVGAYSPVARQGYLFSFNPFQYPDLFTPEQLAWCKQVGPYSHSNRAGWTRDHKVSVNDAIRYGYDVFYIRHPLNCDLMSFEMNNAEKTNSSMSFAELAALVDAYEAARLQGASLANTLE